jgi:hypothetical protein
MEREMKPVPNPGSYDAYKLGCICPQMDNHHGQGIPNSRGERLFWITQGCSLHDVKNKQENWRHPNNDS